MSPLSNNSNAAQSEASQISSSSAFKPLMSESRPLLTMSSSVESNDQYTEHPSRKLLKRFFTRGLNSFKPNFIHQP